MRTQLFWFSYSLLLLGWCCTTCVDLCPVLLTDQVVVYLLSLSSRLTACDDGVSARREILLYGQGSVSDTAPLMVIPVGDRDDLSSRSYLGQVRMDALLVTK